MPAARSGASESFGYLLGSRSNRTTTLESCRTSTGTATATTACGSRARRESAAFRFGRTRTRAQLRTPGDCAQTRYSPGHSGAVKRPDALILPPAAVHVIAAPATVVSPVAVNPTALKSDVWPEWSSMLRGEIATWVTTEPGSASDTGFSQAKGTAVRNSTNRSFIKANRADSLCLNVM